MSPRLSSRLVLFLACPLIFLCSSLSAEQKAPQGIPWQPSFSKAFISAKERNCPVLIAFIQDDEEANERIVSQFYTDPELVRAMGKFVSLIASRNTSSEHGIVKKTREGRLKEICKKYGSVTCLEHRQVEREAFLAYFPDGLVKTPQHIFCAPDGKALHRLIDVPSKAQFLATMEDVLTKVGKGLSRTEYENFKEYFRKGRRAFLAKKYAESVRKYRKITDSGNKVPFVTRAMQEIEEIEALGMEELSIAKEKLEEKKYAEAWEGFEVLRSKYEGTSVAENAAQAIKALEEIPAAKKAREASRRARRAQDIYLQAGQLEREGKVMRAISLYRKVETKYPSTSWARLAAARLKAMEDSGILAEKNREKAEKECKSMLAMGDSYRKNGYPDKAKKYYEKIIKNYPDSPYAKEAEKRLKDLD